MSIQIGYIESITGDATLTHSDGKTAKLVKNALLSENEIITTGANATVIVKLNDGSSFTITPGQRMTLDKTVHDSIEIAPDETRAEADSLKAILAESPELSIFEQTAAGDVIAVGGSSLIIDSIEQHNDNSGDAGSSMLDPFASNQIIPAEEEDDLFGVFPYDTPIMVALDNILTNDNTPTINGMINDTTASVIITIDGKGYTAVNNGDGTWTLPNTDPMPDGEAVITVVGKDQSGNTTTVTATITVDTVPPVITVATTPTNDTTPAISGTTDDPTAEIVVTVGGSDYTATNNGDGTWTVDVTGTLPQGDNTVTVIATDPAGNSSTETATLIVDTTPPAVALDTTPTNDTTPTISGTTDDPTAEIVVTVGGNNYTATNNGDGTWTLVDGEVGILPQGPTEVTVTATDTAGNATVITGNVVVDSFLTDDDNDNGGKVVTIDSITDDNGLSDSDFITNDTTLIIRGTYDNETGNTLVVTLDGLVVPVVITDKQWEADLQGTPLTDGIHRIEATVTDLAGNIVTIAKEIVIDTSATDNNGTGNGIDGADATVTLDEISDNYINLEESQTGVTVTGTTTLLAGNDVTIEFNGKSYVTTATGGDVSGTANTFSVTIPAQDLTGVTDGTYIVTATVVADTAGNLVSDSEDVIVDRSISDNNGTGSGIDGADATVTLDEISDNYINLDETLQGITVTGTTTLLSGNEVTIEFNGTTYTTTSTGSDTTGVANTFSLTIPSTDLTTVPDGTYIVTATVVADSAGNTASDTEDVTVDTSNSDNNGNGNTLNGADATITLHEISGNYINSAETGENLLITGTSTATPGSAVTIEITGGDGVAHNINEFLDPDPVIEVNAFGNFSVTFVATAFSLFADGEYTVTATVVADNAGNTVSDTQTVLLDTTFTDEDGDFPQGGGNLITIDSITDDTGADNNDFITSDNRLIISGSFDNETLNRILSVTVDGVAYNVATSTDTADKSWSVDLQNVVLSDGDHTVVATIADEAGNTQTATQVITIDTRPADADAIVLDEISNNYINGLEHDQPLTISGSVGSASNDGDAVTVELNGITYNTTVSGGRFTVDVPVGDVQALTDGTVYTATATTSTATLTVSDTEDVTVDLALTNTGNNNGNLITIDGITEDTGISNSDFITSDKTIIISGTYDNATDINGIANILTITIDGQLYTPVVSGTDWNVDLTNTPLSDGDYELIATVTDAAGNSVSQTQIITIDATVDPSVGDATILLDPISDNYINLNETTSDTLIAVTGSTTAANGAVVTIYVEGTLFTTTLAQDGLFSIDIPKDTFTLYPDGTYVVTAEVIADAAGNIASDSQTVILDTSVTDTTGGNGIGGADATVTLDAVTGTINIADTQNGITITGTTTLVAGNNVVVELNGISYVTTATGANSTSTPNTFSVTIPAADIAALSDGSSYVVSATIIVDKAGNSVSDQENVSTDFTAPVVTVDDLNTQDTTPGFTGTIDDPTAAVVITVGGKQYTAVNNGDGSWTLADNTVDALTPGEVAITVTATDPAGNSASSTTSTGTITIDALPVAYDNVDLIEASTGTTTSGNVITDSYNGLSDTLGDGTTAVTSITYDGVVYDTFAADGTLTVNAKYGDITFQRDGSYIYTYTGQDSVITGGNQVNLWNNVGLFAFQGGSGDSYLLDGKLNIGALATHTGDVSENSLGIGVADSGFFSSDAIDGNDALVLEFGDNISEVKLHLNNTSFFDFFAGTTVSIFDADGNLMDTIDTFHFISFFGSANDTIQIDMGGVDFKYVVIESSSDVYLDEVSYTPAVTTTTDVTETFSYTITDSDGDSSTANLTIDGNNNTILFDSNALLQDGGLGIDTLILNPVDDLDFSTISNLKNMEIIDLAGGDHAVSNLTVADIINMTDSNNVLSIYGDIGDNVSKPVGTTETWTQTATGVDDGNGHTVDVYSVSDGSNTVTVNIEQDIIVS